MTKHIEERLEKIPVVSLVARLFKQIRIPGLQGLTLYDLCELYGVGIVKGALTTRAGGISFSFLMAICPFLVFTLTLIPYVPIPGFEEDFLFLIKQWFPPTTSEAAQEQVINYILNHNYGGVISIYFVISIVLMTNGVHAVFDGFGHSYHISVGRHMIPQYLISLGVSVLLAGYLVLTAVVAFYFEVGIERLKARGFVNNDVAWIMVGQKVFFATMVFICVSTLLYFGPRDGKKLSSIFPGAILTTLLFLLFTYLFGIYVVHFSNHTELYGSIGTLLVFMIFIWLNSIILLLGFELNASLNKILNRAEESR